MNELSELSPAALDALAHPPSCLANFARTAKPGAEPIFVDFALGCRSCAGEAFQVFSFPKVVPDPSPYYGLEAGEVLQRPPHRLRCAGCGSDGVTFDPRKHGFDAVLNDFSSYECGDEGEEAAPGLYRVTAGFAYNNDFEENQTDARDKGVQASDLFDAFRLVCEPIDDEGSRIDLEYELA